MCDFLWLPSMGCQYRYHIAIFIGFASRYVGHVSPKRLPAQIEHAIRVLALRAAHAGGIAMEASDSRLVSVPGFAVTHH